MRQQWLCWAADRAAAGTADNHRHSSPHQGHRMMASLGAEHLDEYAVVRLQDWLANCHPFRPLDILVIYEARVHLLALLPGPVGVNELVRPFGPIPASQQLGEPIALVAQTRFNIQDSGGMCSCT